LPTVHTPEVALYAVGAVELSKMSPDGRRSFTTTPYDVVEALWFVTVTV
jgi:hypothetical protein